MCVCGGGGGGEIMEICTRMRFIWAREGCITCMGNVGCKLKCKLDALGELDMLGELFRLT